MRHLRFDLGREDFLCIVLGNGDALSLIKSLAVELGVNEKIWFAGWVNDPDLYFRYLSTADICAAPEPSNSYNDRSTFVKVLDYMAAGKPIVAFDIPETHFSAGPAALYVCPNDEREFALKLAELMDDAGLRVALGEAGRRPAGPSPGEGGPWRAPPLTHRDERLDPIEDGRGDQLGVPQRLDLFEGPVSLAIQEDALGSYRTDPGEALQDLLGGTVDIDPRVG